MDAADALARVAKASGLKLKKVGANSYLLLAGNPSPPKRAERSKPTVKVPKAEPAPATNEGEEVIVVASKRDTLSQRFAGQWLQIDGEEFAPLGVPGTEAIEARSVGFSSTHLGAGRNKLFIRGIADSSFSGPTQSPVGQYFGDMRTGYSGPDPDLKLVDMQVGRNPRRAAGHALRLGRAWAASSCLKPNMPSFGRMSGLVGAGTTVNLARRCGLRFVGSAQCSDWRNAALCESSATKPRRWLRRQSRDGREGHQRRRHHAAAARP